MSRDPEEMHPLAARARGAARHVALDVLAMREGRAGRIEEALARPRVHLPYLHAVPPGEEPRLRELLAALAPTHTFISYSEAVDRIRRGAIDRPYMAFSFDDAFASNARTAGILEEFGATGMFFVPPGFLGTPTVSEARAFYGFSQGVDEPAMTWADVEGLVARGHEVGNHTLGHEVMSWVDAGPGPRGGRRRAPTACAPDSARSPTSPGRVAASTTSPTGRPGPSSRPATRAVPPPSAARTSWARPAPSRPCACAGTT